MQTFLPYPNFVDSARCLDFLRLNCQIKETKQILDIILNNKKAWANHPAVNMWRGYELALFCYGEDCASVAKEYGIATTKWKEFSQKIYEVVKEQKPILPKWLGHEQLHSSHRAALLKKNPQWYRGQKWTETPKIDYFWPTKNGY